MTAVIELRVDVDASVQAVWDGAVDWERQGEWMLGTQVHATRFGGRGTGGQILAKTAIGPVSVVDTMEITQWDPPRVCRVLHTGALVKGIGVFSVEPRGDAATFVWREELELPLGRLGQLGWPLVKPVFAWGVLHSLRQFARWVEAGRPPAGH